MKIVIEYSIIINLFTIHHEYFDGEPEYSRMRYSKLNRFIEVGLYTNYGCFVGNGALEKIDCGFKDLIDTILEYNPKITTDGYRIYYVLEVE